LWGLLGGSVYLVLTSVYIYASTHWVSQNFHTIEQIEFMELLKGIAFVTCTALLVGYLIYLLLHHQERHLHIQMSEQRRSVTGLLAAATAHDINNILQNMVLQLELLPKGKCNPECGEALVELKTCVRDLSSMMQTMRDFGRDIMPGEFTSVDLAEVTQSTLKLIRREPLLSNKTIEADIPETCPIHANGTMLRQALLNLLLNAGQATPDGGTIRVNLSCHSDHTLLLVEDSGPGISPKTWSKIFSPYYSGSGHGTGLGLFSVQSIAKTHQGSVEYVDSPLGGAGIQIRLPTAA